MRDESNSVLVISTMQTIAGNWLAPRLGGFQLLHPEFAVRIDISTSVVDLDNEGVDVVIRSGKGHWPGLTSHFLLSQTFTPVCSPHYIAREGRPETPEQIPNHVLIDRNDIWWPIWFETAGLPRECHRHPHQHRCVHPADGSHPCRCRLRHCPRFAGLCER